MKTKHLRPLILFGTLALTGLFLVQLYWFKKAFDAEDRQFDHRVQVALMRVADSVTTHAEVKKLSSSFYVVATESNLDSNTISNLLRVELLKRNLPLEYELGIYDAEDDTLVFGLYVEASRKILLDSSPAGPRSEESLRNFAVFFPKKESFVTGQLDVWIFSTVTLLLMTCFFTYAILTILRERKFAELRNDFINNMTHEFKTPVTNIGITGEIIRRKVPEEAGVNVYVDILLRENEKLRKKIDDVLLGSSVEGHKRLSLERVDIHALITECAEAFDLKVRERNGLLRLDLNATSNFILGDRELLFQAINNVIDNAEKYSPTTPQIVVRTTERNEGIEIDITDRGIGIPYKMQRKVFEKFFRVHHGNIHNVKGFGLGLSFVRTVVQSHHGTVRLFSRVDQGTNVKILFPRA